jgi:NADPH:quinone reductase
MYSQYRCAKAAQCVELPDDCTAADGAAMFVNPLTALCMVDVMRKEGHKAIVHTVAASNLGQMLIKLCQKEHIGLVNIVRSQSQHDLLEDMGATGCSIVPRPPSGLTLAWPSASAAGC